MSHRRTIACGTVQGRRIFYRPSEDWLHAGIRLLKPWKWKMRKTRENLVNERNKECFSAFENMCIAFIRIQRDREEGRTCSKLPKREKTRDSCLLALAIIRRWSEIQMYNSINFSFTRLAFASCCSENAGFARVLFQDNGKSMPSIHIHCDDSTLYHTLPHS